MDSYLIVIVIFALSVTIYEIFINIFFYIDNESQEGEKQDLAIQL